MGCSNIDIDGRRFLADLIIMSMERLDVILDMDLII